MHDSTLHADVAEWHALFSSVYIYFFSPHQLSSQRKQTTEFALFQKAIQTKVRLSFRELKNKNNLKKTTVCVHWLEIKKNHWKFLQRHFTVLDT